jgi:hypothetical protein
VRMEIEESIANGILTKTENVLEICKIREH